MSWSSYVPGVRRAKCGISNERLTARRWQVPLRGQVRQLATMSKGDERGTQIERLRIVRRAEDRDFGVQ
jgi:hypothetical protein